MLPWSLLFAALSAPLMAQLDDPRNIATGHVIPSEGYADQPYVVKTGDATWLCLMTTGKGVEGEGGQHIIAMTSRDQGRTWSAPVDIEPASGPEASWVVPLKLPSGRIYAFYTYNRDNVRLVPEAAGRVAHRVDTLGVYAFKYSDDHGRTWSPDRYEIPLRPLPSDLENNFGGKTLFFWGVAKPLVERGAVYLGFGRISRWGAPGTLVRSRGFIMRSDNLLAESDPAKIRWTMLPDGDEGFRAPKGPISEETNLAALSDGTLFAVYRTIDGYLCHAYSRDRGKTWTPPEYATYSPGGRRIKNPRAFSLVRRFSNGKFLLWYHNHGGDPVHLIDNWQYYGERNPGWVIGGVERGGRIHWSEPEVLLYDDDPKTRISYPDFIEDDGRFLITETQKSVARVHEIDRRLLDSLWAQLDPAAPADIVRGGLALEIPHAPAEFDMPLLPSLAGRGGFALDFWIRLKELSPGQVILDTRDAAGKGIALTLSQRFSLKLILSDGRRESSWESDPGTHAGTLRTGQWQHVSVLVDGGPKIISFVIDGVFNDGGPIRQYGWGRFDPAIADVNGIRRVKLAPFIHGDLRGFRLYNRRLLTSEAVHNYRATLGAGARAGTNGP